MCVCHNFSFQQNFCACSMALHIVVFPWLAFGHMLPYLELSKSFARRGHKISFISTPRNIKRFPNTPPQISHLITFVPLTLPKVDGLPETAEATSDLPPESVEYLKVAFDQLDEPFRKFIREEVSPRPDWIIQDFAHHWIPRIASEADVPTVFLSITMAGSLVFFGPLTELGENPSRTTPEQYSVPPPWVPFPSKLRLRLHEARRVFRENVAPNATGISDMGRLKIVLEGCKAIAVRSSTEIESQWLELLPKILDKPVLPVGLLPPPTTEAGRENDNAGEGIRNRIIEWLDSKKPGSTVYIAFGSEATLGIAQLHELALGVEISRVSFVWALRKPSGVTTEREWLPEGFEERTKERGIVAKGWVPQMKILAHESIGGFLTHSGWSSVIESLQFGHPLVLLPIFLDQGIIARVFIEKGVAVEIERDEEDGTFMKGAVAAALKLAMIDEEGESYRKKAKELVQVFTDTGRQEEYIDDFIRFLSNHGTKI